MYTWKKVLAPLQKRILFFAVTFEVNVNSGCFHNDDDTPSMAALLHVAAPGASIMPPCFFFFFFVFFFFCLFFFFQNSVCARSVHMGHLKPISCNIESLYSYDMKVATME